MRTVAGLTVGLIVACGLVAPAAAEQCPPDSVKSGTICIDKYEASMWHVPPAEKKLVEKIREGKVELADLQEAGVVQLGLNPGDLADAGCPPTGSGCVSIYAVSIPGVLPSRYHTWFQALAAARNSHKRLPTNQEWQAAALGTPDGAPCRVVPAGGFHITGGNPGCVSDVGAFDMVGGIGERVADWADQGNPGLNCTNWPAEYGDDLSCVGGVGSSGANRLPGVALRGGYFGSGTGAGVFAAVVFPTESATNTFGFRCAR